MEKLICNKNLALSAKAPHLSKADKGSGPGNATWLTRDFGNSSSEQEQGLLKNKALGKLVILGLNFNRM